MITLAAASILPADSAPAQVADYSPPAVVDLQHATDDALLNRIRRRDDAAFRLLLDRHMDPVHGYLVRMTGNRQEAEDLTQETFLRIWLKADSYRPGRVKVSTWIHTIAHNLCVDTFRKRREVLTSSGTPLEQRTEQWTEQQTEQQDVDAGPERQVLLSHTIDQLNHAIVKLPDAQRAALLLCHVQGFSNAEAAEIMSLSVRALESLIARARRSLKSQVFDNGEQPWP